MSCDAERDRARRLLGLLDLTRLDDRCTEADIASLCRAATAGPAVAAVCVWPQFVGVARRTLAGSEVRVAAVINFPSGGEDVERVADDISETVGDGADEIDLVMPWRAFLRGDVDAVEAVIGTARESASGKILKVIVESGELGRPETIREASRLALACGADFVKTSTGKSAVSATPDAARVMLEAVRDCGRPAGFKASGGIRTFAEADLYLALAESILGRENVSPATFRIGASALHGALLDLLAGGDEGVETTSGPHA